MILFLFFCSGATALVYEVLWSKYLSLLLGSTIYAQTVVLAVFMGGLALGNRLIGARSDLLSRPLVAYGALEVAIGLFAFSFNWIYRLADNLFVAGGSHLLGQPWGLMILKAVLSVSLLIVPTLLMGGTLPLLAAWLKKQSNDAGRWSARFYSINSLGAVCGACLAGFVLIRRLGLESSLQMTALANVLIGFIAVALGRQETPATIERGSGAVEPAPATAKWILFLVALTGAVSMGLEVLASRALGLIFGASVQAFAIVLMAFILGIGLGSSVIASPRLQRWRQETLVFTLLLSAAAVVGLLVFGIEYWVDAYCRLLSGLARTPMGYRFYQLMTGGFSLVILGIPAALIGAVLPLGIRLVSEQGRDLGNQVGRLLTWNTVGAVAGVLVTGFVLMPKAGLRNAFYILALALCVPVLVRAGMLKRKVVLALAGLLVAGVVASWATGDQSWRYVVSSGVFRERSANTSRASLLARRDKVKILFYEDAADATVSVEKNIYGVSLRINGKPEASSRGDLGTQMMLGHLPMMIRPESKDIFVLGLASGISASTFLAHPIDRLVVADNCAPVTRAVHLFNEWNKGVVTNPLTHVWLEDARTVLKISPQHYDVIVSEPSNPWFASVGSVFSREFYQIAAGKLKPGGLMVQWFHVYEMHDGIVEMVLRTFGSVFPAMEVWDASPGDLILVGSDRPWDSSIEHLRTAFARPEVRKELASIGITSAESLLARQFASQRTAFAIAGQGAIQSDNFPVLEYEAPLAFFVGNLADRLFRFDERTWQSELASPEKRAAFSHFDQAALKAAFQTASVNYELRTALTPVLGVASAAPSPNDPSMPCLFRPPVTEADLGNTITNTTVKSIALAQLALQAGATNWTDEVSLIQTTLRQALAEHHPEVIRAAPHALAAALRACLAHRDLAAAKPLLELGAQIAPDHAELGYLGRLCERAAAQTDRHVSQTVPR